MSDGGDEIREEESAIEIRDNNGMKDPDLEADQDAEGKKAQGKTPNSTPRRNPYLTRRLKQSEATSRMATRRRHSEPASRPSQPASSVKRRNREPGKGDRLRVLWHVDCIYYEGVVEEVVTYRKKKFYHLLFKSGEREDYVDLTVRKWFFVDGRDDGVIHNYSTSIENEDLPDYSKFPICGDKVLIMWHVDEKYYPGVVSNVYRDSRRLFHDIKYDSGHGERDLDLRVRKWQRMANLNDFPNSNDLDADEAEAMQPPTKKEKHITKPITALKSTPVPSTLKITTSGRRNVDPHSKLFRETGPMRGPSVSSGAPQSEQGYGTHHKSRKKGVAANSQPRSDIFSQLPASRLDPHRREDRSREDRSRGEASPYLEPVDLGKQMSGSKARVSDIKRMAGHAAEKWVNKEFASIMENIEHLERHVEGLKKIHQNDDSRRARQVKEVSNENMGVNSPLTLVRKPSESTQRSL